MSDEKDGVVLTAATIVQYNFNNEKEIKFVKPENEIEEEVKRDKLDKNALKRGVSKFVFVVKNITVEPVMLFFALGVGILPIVLNQLYFDKVCKTGSNLFGNGTSYSDKICDNLDSGDYEDIENFVQKQVAKITAVSNFLQAIPPLIFVWILGAWSDRFGRKFLMFISLTGFIILDLELMANVIWFRVS